MKIAFSSSFESPTSYHCSAFKYYSLYLDTFIALFDSFKDTQMYTIDWYIYTDYKPLIDFISKNREKYPMINFVLRDFCIPKEVENKLIVKKSWAEKIFSVRDLLDTYDLVMQVDHDLIFLKDISHLFEKALYLDGLFRLIRYQNAERTLTVSVGEMMLNKNSLSKLNRIESVLKEQTYTSDEKLLYDLGLKSVYDDNFHFNYPNSMYDNDYDLIHEKDDLSAYVLKKQNLALVCHYNHFFNFDSLEKYPLEHFYNDLYSTGVIASKYFNKRLKDKLIQVIKSRVKYNPDEMKAILSNNLWGKFCEENSIVH